MTGSSHVAPRRSRGRLSLLGLGLAVLGVLVYVVQVSFQRLMIPWYMPVLGLIGAFLGVLSLSEKRTVGRVFALLAVVLLTGAEFAFLYAVRLPPYTGPIAKGRPFPAFNTTLADGRQFTQRDLISDQSSVLVFFRGRW